MEYNTFAKKQTKKLYFKDCNIYEKINYNDKLIKLITINMSWVPISFIKRIYYYSIYGKFPPFYITLFDEIKRISKKAGQLAFCPLCLSSSSQALRFFDNVFLKVFIFFIC